MNFFLLQVRPGSPGPANAGQERASVSNDNNILLDPDILTDHVTQVTLKFCRAILLSGLVAQTSLTTFLVGAGLDGTGHTGQVHH